MRKIAVLLFSAALFMTCSSALAFDDDDEESLIASLPSNPSLSVSTIPSNGDLNPYGVAFVPHGFPGGGTLQAALAGATGPSFLSALHHVSTVASAVPANGDVNPYGVAVVPVTAGALVANSELVSNFNNSANLQGTGTTMFKSLPA